MLECWKVGRTKQNPLWSADFWTVTDKVVFGLAICTWFCGAWKSGAKPRSSEGVNGQRREDAIWWALMHILEEWAKKSQRERKRTNDTPGPTPKKPMTSGPSGQLGPSGQPESLTPDSSFHTHTVDATCTVDPTPAVDPTPGANPTPGVRPPIVASPPVYPIPVCPLPVCPLPDCPLLVSLLPVCPVPVCPVLVCPVLVCPVPVCAIPVCPVPVCPVPVCPVPVCPVPVCALPVCPLPVCPPPVADTLAGLYGGGLQGLDDHNRRQTGWHKVGRSGTTVQFMSPAGSDTTMMTKILSRFWISGGHMVLFRHRSCRTRVYFAGPVRATSGQY